jgi:ribonuclease HI
VNPVYAYADGSGTRSYLPCGAGVVLVDDGQVVAEASRALGLGTNNHAELSAIRCAVYLTTFPPFAGRPVIVRTDSKYSIGQLTRPAEEVCRTDPNGPLILRIRADIAQRPITFEHVYGHRGDVHNVRADRLANLARRRQLVPKETTTP